MAHAEGASRGDATHRPDEVTTREGVFPIGVDHYPLDAERQGYDEWYTGDIDADFAAMAEARLSRVRVFVSWRCLEPQVGQYDEEMAERLENLVAAARAHGLQLIVCFFADDRLAELSAVPWGRHRDPRTDDYLIAREVALAQRIVNRYRLEPAIYAWDLANEAFCTGFTSEEAFERWVITLREAIREVDPTRPILLGVDPETLLRASGVDPRPAIDFSEGASSHLTASYRAYAAEGPLTSGPSTYVDGFLLRAASSDLPVTVDGVGVHSLDFSAAEEAAYVRTVLYSALMNRASGVMLRRWRDLETEKREPYFQDPYEVLVGMVDVAGEPKPVLDEVRAFARVAVRIDPERYALAPERAAVVIPAERYEPLPSLAGLYDPRSCLQSYIAAKEAHVPVTVVREGDPLGGYHALFIPSPVRLTASMWKDLAVFVQGGGSVVLSYGGGDADPAVREIFGVQFLGDAGPTGVMSCRVAQPGVLGGIASFDARTVLPHHALLAASGAMVVATDAKGNPLVTVHQYGQGKAVLLAAPVERAIAQNDPWAAPTAVRHFVREVYGSVARAAGAGAMVECDRPDVELAHFLGEDDDILVVLSHNAEKVTATVTFERVVSTVSDVRGGTPSSVGGKTFGIPLHGNGAVTVRVAYRQQSGGVDVRPA
ncbi:MAG: beta-galactosidase trimerization domain-containing protein [Actinomycetia bacterium]|nr:beta-galactosidase trimerization domain-containing protein [Actinomycetes bacterium]